jgi:SAM-dependent methyltransferase
LKYLEAKMQEELAQALSQIKSTVFEQTLAIRQGLFAGRAYYCPLCESHIRVFLASPPRDRALCPVCYSMPRHRVVWVFLQRMTTLFDSLPKRMLHVAPELIVQRRLRRLAHLDYITADLFNRRAMVKMDITDIHYADHTFDVIYCSHVLEHVMDDRKAMREFYRVLKSGGWAILMVPMSDKPTFEDPTVTDPAERARLFGRFDHVRKYGPDYVVRLQEAGFRVSMVPADEFATPGELHTMALRAKKDVVYYCQKA